VTKPYTYLLGRGVQEKSGEEKGEIPQYKLASKSEILLPP
jgi:hypothetical protein